MLVIEKQTKKSPEKIMAKAKSYFGSDDGGMKLTTNEDRCISFQGGDGYVTVKIFEDDSKKNRVEVTTREYEFQAKQFLVKL